MTLTVVVSHPFAKSAKGWGSLNWGNSKVGPTRHYLLNQEITIRCESTS
jgi:hypothetical protein